MVLREVERAAFVRKFCGTMARCKDLVVTGVEAQVGAADDTVADGDLDEARTASDLVRSTT